MDKVICIVGPTGIGKTKLSIALAHYLNTDVINGDAIQVFKEVDILSAKATKEEQDGIKHHLLDYLNVNETLDVATFKEEASTLIKNLNKEDKIPIIVGGSGLYLKSLLYDYTFDKITERQSDIITKYQNYSNEELYSYLEKIDLPAARILHPNNRKRVLRAIEIYEISKVKKSDFIAQQKHELEFDALIIGLEMPREKLYDRINLRVDKMVEDGLVTEVKNLHEKYHDQNHQVFQAIGYKELLPFIDKEVTLSEALDKIKQNSRRYAKKQITWFKNQMDVNWIESDIENFDDTINKAKNIVKDFMTNE